MKIKLTQKETPIQPIFANIEINQFFIDEEGCLCQKMNKDTCTMLAASAGEPFCTYIGGVSSYMEVTPIANVSKISWE